MIVKPNAGLPNEETETLYDVFSPKLLLLCVMLVISKVVAGSGMLRNSACTYCKDSRTVMSIPVKPIEKKSYTIVSSYGQSVFLGTGSKIIGERINPTGKKRFKQALKELILIIF